MIAVATTSGVPDLQIFMNSLPERAQIGTADPKRNISKTNINAIDDSVNDRKSFRELRFHDFCFHDFHEKNIFEKDIFLPPL